MWLLKKAFENQVLFLIFQTQSPILSAGLFCLIRLTNLFSLTIEPLNNLKKKRILKINSFVCTETFEMFQHCQMTSKP